MIPQVLFITYEFGDKIGGGVGRALNGIVSHIHCGYSVLLIHTEYLAGYSVTLFSASHSTQAILHSERELVEFLLSSCTFNMLHFLSVGPHSYLICREFVRASPETKFVYSVHSITKYEKSIRPAYENYEFYEEYLLRHCHAIHLLSAFSQNALLRVYPNALASKLTKVIPNGVNSQAIWEQVQSKRDARSVRSSNAVCCISRWGKGKGLEILLDAIPIVVREVPDFLLILAGRREQSWEKFGRHYVDRIDRKVTELEVYVKSVGWLNDVERDDLFASCRLFVMPSELEYQPYSVLEPASAKIPMIASDLDPVREILGDDGCFYFKPKSSAELARQLLVALGSFELAESKAESAYERISRLHHWPDIAREYDALYVEVLGAYRT